MNEQVQITEQLIENSICISNCEEKLLLLIKINTEKYKVLLKVLY